MRRKQRALNCLTDILKYCFNSSVRRTNSPSLCPKSSERPVQNLFTDSFIRLSVLIWTFYIQTFRTFTSFIRYCIIYCVTHCVYIFKHQLILSSPTLLHLTLLYPPLCAAQFVIWSSPLTRTWAALHRRYIKLLYVDAWSQKNISGSSA